MIIVMFLLTGSTYAEKTPSALAAHQAFEPHRCVYHKRHGTKRKVRGGLKEVDHVDNHGEEK